MVFSRALLLAAFPLLLLMGFAKAADSGLGKIVVEDRYLKEVPAVIPADSSFSRSTVKGVYYDGPQYKGAPTKVFAYYGLPAVKKGDKVPAMVLIHGGGGTAFADWVRLWNERGYAAIAMDLCGCVPVKNSEGKGWIRIPSNGGPAGWDDSFNRLDLPIQDQWPYYAVNAIARARTFIGSLPEVDGSKVGVTGISWGGYLTCLTAGCDSRYLFAAPVYGCGFLHFKSAWMKKLAEPGMDRWSAQFDPSVYLPDAKMPLLWVTGTNDFAYPMESLKKSYELVKSPVSLCITLRMSHGHGGAGENPAEIKAFADSFCLGGAPLPSITGQGVDDGVSWVSFKSQTPVKGAELIFTKDTGYWKDLKWESIPAQLDASSSKASAKVPDGASFHYMNLKDERGLVVSSRQVEAAK